MRLLILFSKGRGILTRECNAAGWIDRQIFRKDNMYVHYIIDVVFNEEILMFSEKDLPNRSVRIFDHLFGYCDLLVRRRIRTFEYVPHIYVNGLR